MLSRLKRSHLGIIVPVAVVVVLAGSVFTAGAASAGRISPRQHNGAQGVVTAMTVAGATATCGTAGDAGTLTLAGGMRQAVTAVDVTATTTYKDPAVTTPTFANVCVGSRVIALGTLTSGTLTATLVAVVPAQAQGVVAAMTVAGATATCGTAGDAGTLTLAGGMRQAVTAVDVTATTTYKDPAVTTPTFANVCVGSRVIALGTVSSGTLAATLVTVVPAQAQGVVTAMTVAGATATCGTAGDSGSFTLGGIWPMPMVANAPRLAMTVDVTSTTTFTDVALTTPTFANVCVGSRVIALGTLTSGTLTATLVTVVPAQTQGVVTAMTVAGVTATCGTAGDAGSFTLGGIWPTPVVAIAPWLVTTVDVTATTTYKDPAVTTPTFANVCVGSRVVALGTLTSGTLTATLVTVVPAQAQGVVTAVTVAGATATCGTAGDAGSFTLGGIGPIPVVASATRLVTTVDVTATTTFSDAAVTAPSSATFADVCVGSRVIALGALASGTLTATSVAIVPPLNLTGGHGNRRGHGKG